MPRRELTEKQRRFVVAYTGEARGNATEAARLAGYDGDDASLASVGWSNLRKVEIQQAIKGKAQPGIKRRNALMRFWSDSIDAMASDRDRLKASELLAKSQGLFLDRHEVSGPGGKPLEFRPVREWSNEELDAEIARERAKRAKGEE